MVRASALAIGALALALASLSQAQTYLPLLDGNWWKYESQAGEIETQTVDGTIFLRGTSVAVIRYSGGFNDQNENYWTVASDGDVFLWGFYFPPEEFGFLYDPPILYLDSSPLFVGKTWETSGVRFYTLPDTIYFGTFDLSFEVYESGEISVPAGTFFAYGVGPSSPPIPALEGRSVSGVQASERAVGPDTWWTEDIGAVQLRSWAQLQLVDYRASPTPVSRRSWGVVKWSYQSQ